MNDNEKRAAELAEALRRVADMVAANPDLVSAFEIGFKTVPAYIGHTFPDKPAALAAAARAGLRHGAKVVKDADDKWSGVDMTWGPVKVSAYASREEVRERVQVGEETVTKTVPDPTVEVPMVEVTETVPKYEWRCAPILAAEGGVSS